MDKYRKGDLVWAKMKGYPHWPARVDDASNDRRMQIFFFGTHETGWLGSKCLLRYEEHKAKYARPLKTSRFMEGLIEIEKDPKIELGTCTSHLDTPGSTPSSAKKAASFKPVPRRRTQSLGSAASLPNKVSVSRAAVAAMLAKKRMASSAQQPRRSRQALRIPVDRMRSPTRSAPVSDFDQRLLSIELSLKESLTVEAPNVHTSVGLLNELKQSSIPYKFLRTYPEFALTIKKACHYRQSSAVVQRAKELFQSLRWTALVNMEPSLKLHYVECLRSADPASLATLPFASSISSGGEYAPDGASQADRGVTPAATALTTADVTTADVTTADVATANVTTADVATANVTTADVATANVTTA
eukprot:scpid81972/ scgid5333/ Lens epithelium-derived growth factor